MKKFYSIATVLVASMFFAQTTISFEASEGYTLGNINGQNGWTVTEANNSPLTNQIVTDEVAKTGNYSFKNAYVSEFSDQLFPIFGIEKSFSPSLDYKNTTISYDFRGNLKGESDFEFATYNYNQQNDEFDILFAVGFDNRGYIYIFKDMNFGGFTYANPTWDVDKWYNMKIEITENSIVYYLDGVEILNTPNTSKLNIDGFNFLHNNYGGDAYYDNIKINDEALSVGTVNKHNVKLYPNPVKDVLKIDIDKTENIDEISLYNTAGQKIKTFTNQKEINVENLPKGLYIVDIKTTNNKVYKSKIIKK